jgi:predicted nucleic acid-binding protein
VSFFSTRELWSRCSTGARSTTARFAAFLRGVGRPVVSSEAVLTEATHLLGGLAGGRQACIDFFLSGGALLVPATTASLRRARELVSQYSDLPMDYADATLVALAEELGTSSVLTDRSQGLRRLPDQGPAPLRRPA